MISEKRRKVYVRRLVLEIALDHWVDNKVLNDFIRDCFRTRPDESCGQMTNNILEVMITNVKSIPTPRYHELTNGEENEQS